MSDAGDRKEQSFDLLKGVTVVEFGDDIAGSITAYHLAMLGATVIIVEPAQGCWLRRLHTDTPGPSSAPLFACFGRGKRSVSYERMLEAVAPWASVDVVIEPFDAAIADQFPQLFANDDPAGPLVLSYREADGTRLSELGAQATFGVSAFLGRPDEAPYRVGFELITYSAAVLAVQAILAALPGKRECGLSQRLRVPFSRVAANILNNVTTASVEPEQQTGFSRSWASSPYFGVGCADGEVELLFYGPTADRDWGRFVSRLGLPGLATDKRFAAYSGRTQFAGDLREALAPATLALPRKAVLELAVELGGMAVPRWGSDEVARSEQVRANDLLIPRASADRYQLLASPWAINGRRAALTVLPDVAQHTASFLSIGAQS